MSWRPLIQFVFNAVFSKVGVLLFLKGNVLISPTKYLFSQEVLRVFVCICYPLQHNKISIAAPITDGFSVRQMYRKLMFSPPLDFPSRSIWNPIVPPKLGFFAWEAS